MSEKVEKKKRVSKKKVEGGPVKSKSSYLHFCAEEREKIKSDGLSLKNTEIITELGLRWSKLKESDPERLAKYEAVAKQDKERYSDEKKAFKTASLSKVVEEETVVEENVTEPVVVEKPKKKGATKKKVKEEVVEEEDEVVVVVEEKKEEPKKKVNGYINFCKVNRSKVKEDNPGLQPKELTSELGRLWKALSEQEQAKYK